MNENNEKICFCSIENDFESFPPTEQIFAQSEPNTTDNTLQTDTFDEENDEDDQLEWSLEQKAELFPAEIEIGAVVRQTALCSKCGLKTAENSEIIDKNAELSFENRQKTIVTPQRSVKSNSPPSTPDELSFLSPIAYQAPR